MPTVETPPLQMQYEVETRAPGSGWVLPANPLTSLSDDKLEAFIDCTLYEETEDMGTPDVLALPKDGGALVMPVGGRESTSPITMSASVAGSASSSASSSSSLLGGMPALPGGSGAASTSPADTKSASSPRLPGVNDTPPVKPSLSSALAGNPEPAKGREQISTLLGVAPLIMPKIDAPIVTPSQPPKPFRATPVKMDAQKVDGDAAKSEQSEKSEKSEKFEKSEASEKLAASERAAKPTEASEQAKAATAIERPARAQTEKVTRSVIKPRDAAIALACAIALVIVVVLASSSSKKPASSPAPATTPDPAAKPAPEVTNKTVEPAGSDATPETPEEDPAIEMDPAPKPKVATTCSITITTEPPGAIVHVDNAKAGPSPVTLAGPCKRRKIEVSASGFESQTKRVVVKDGDTFDFALVSKKKPPEPKPDPKKSGANGAKPGTTTPPTKPKTGVDI